MRMRHIMLSAMLLVTVQTAGSATPWRVRRDYIERGGYSIGDASAAVFEIWEAATRFRAGRLEFMVWTDLPQAGAVLNDSYSASTTLTLGDLWVGVGSKDPFAGQGVAWHAVALTTHDNVAQQKYVGETWPLVTQGNLYKNAEFATGTFEPYQQFMRSNNYWFSPDDRDGDDTLNSYKTFIKDFDVEVTGKSGADWVYSPYWYWDDVAGDWKSQDAWRVVGSVDLAEIGLTPGAPFSVFISCECGNDGACPTCFVPEPMGVVLAGLGLTALRAIRRANRRADRRG